MTHRRRKRLLWLTIAALAAGTAVSAGGLLLAPLATFSGPGDRDGGDAGSGGGAARRARAETLADYAAIYRRDLRKPLVDPKPVAPTVRLRRPKPKMTVTLVGTAVEPGFTYAMFRTRGHGTKLVRVGETIEGVEVLSVATDSARVRFAGEVRELKKVGKEGAR